MSTKRFPELSERLLFILKDCGITQAEMAKRLKCSPAHISQMRGGKKKVIGDSLAQHISDVYGYRFEWVKSGEEPLYNEKETRKLASELNELESLVEKKIEHLEHEVFLLRELLNERKRGRQ